MRALLVKFRTMQVNQLRGLLYEFGVTFRAGRVAGLAEIRARMAELEDALPGVMIGSLQDQLKRIDGLEQDIDRLEKRIGTWQKQEAACRAIAEVPGIGKLTATALVATMGDAKTFKSGREFASFLGLVPRQSGTGGKIRLGSISKRGDPYLRTLLIHGARSVMYHAKAPTTWQTSDSGTTTGQRGGGGLGQQDGTNGVGDSGSRSGVSEGLREREACVAN